MSGYMTSSTPKIVEDGRGHSMVGGVLGPIVKWNSPDMRTAATYPMGPFFYPNGAAEGMSRKDADILGQLQQLSRTHMTYNESKEAITTGGSTDIELMLYHSSKHSHSEAFDYSRKGSAYLNEIVKTAMTTAKRIGCNALVLHMPTTASGPKYSNRIVLAEMVRVAYNEATRSGLMFVYLVGQSEEDLFHINETLDVEDLGYPWDSPPADSGLGMCELPPYISDKAEQVIEVLQQVPGEDGADFGGSEEANSIVPTEASAAVAPCGPPQHDPTRRSKHGNRVPGGEESKGRTQRPQRSAKHFFQLAKAIAIKDGISFDKATLLLTANCNEQGVAVPDLLVNALEQGNELWDAAMSNPEIAKQLLECGMADRAKYDRGDWVQEEWGPSCVSTPHSKFKKKE